MCIRDRIKSFLTTFSGGQLDFKLCEDFDPCLINLPRMERVIDKYRDNILGLKIRLSKGVVPDDKGLEYLKRIVDLAEELDNKLGTSLRAVSYTHLDVYKRQSLDTARSWRMCG